MTMNLRLSDDTERALEELAAESGLSKNKMVERLIVERRENDNAYARLDFLARKTTDGAPDLMERLRDA